MLTRSIDAALDAIAACRSRTPALLGVFRVDAPERAAIERLITALDAVERALESPGRNAPPGAHVVRQPLVKP